MTAPVVIFIMKEWVGSLQPTIAKGCGPRANPCGVQVVRPKWFTKVRIRGSSTVISPPGLAVVAGTAT